MIGEDLTPDQPSRPRSRRSNSRTGESVRAGWRDLLTELGIHPSKALGQNFLHDQTVVRRIIEVADLGPDDLVIEIGPGLGILTRGLADRAGRVIAIELDQRLAEHLEAGDLGRNVRILRADALTVDVQELTGGQPYLVVANLPYSVASAVVEHLLEAATRPIRLVVMVQREVAERMVARPPDMSILAVAVQFYGQPRIAFRVGSGAFVPAPKVESAVVRIDVRPELPLDDRMRPGFFRLVRAGFGQRRKSLLNALSAGLARDKVLVGEALSEAGIDPQRRAETLEVDDWVRLCRIAGKHGLLDDPT